MLFVFILIFPLYLGVNAYVFSKGMHAFSQLPAVPGVIVAILFWICALGIGAMFLFRNVTFSPVAGLLIQYIATGWLVFIFYITILLLFLDLLKLFHVYPPYGFQVVLVITVATLLYGYYRYKHPETEVINIVINKSLTTDQQVKVVGISDIHLGYATNKQQLRKYVEMVMAEQPDLIIIGGDLIDNSVVPVRYQTMQEELSLLSAPLGVYMVPGNHEYISGIQPAIEFIAETPIILLKDSVVTLPNGIQIIGRDDRMNPNRKTLEELATETNPVYPVLLLDHQPYDLDETVDAGVDLQFSGHTHRGQIWPVSWLTDRLFEVSHGYKKKDSSHIYVSTGLSLWGPPFRIGTNSEMAVFNLTFKE